MARGKEKKQEETRVVVTQPVEPTADDGYGIASAIAEAQEQIQLRKQQKAGKKKGFFYKLQQFRDKINSIGQKKKKD